MLIKFKTNSTTTTTKLRLYAYHDTLAVELSLVFSMLYNILLRHTKKDLGEKRVI